jgi:hypothetical protein
MAALVAIGLGAMVFGCAGVEQRSGGDASVDGNLGPDGATYFTDAAPGPSDGGQTEICGNGLDDNQDGRVDEGCACTIGEVHGCFRGNPKYAGKGACKPGSQTCQASNDDVVRAAWSECVGQGAPTPEICNGVDDDCDGKIDDFTEACTSGCGQGTRTCIAGGWSACSATVMMRETCNGIDDDCDGKIDGMVQSCATACGQGTQTCTAGTWSACSTRTPAAETCNGVDDDCDGKIDGMVQSCASACGQGTQTCTAGTWSACSARTPTTEVCNGIDDDCDGKIDGMVQSCASACGQGTQTCTAGKWSTCSARTPTTEICNGLDDDCDGKADEDLKATWTFRNLCRSSSVFVVTNGCNVCAQTCTGYWVNPGADLPLDVAQNTCFTYSAFARTPSGDVCLDADGNGYVGETRRFCNGDCQPDLVTMSVVTGC